MEEYAGKSREELLDEIRRLKQEVAAVGEEGAESAQLSFRSLVEAAEDIITVVDSTGTIVYQSPAVQRMLARHRDQRAVEPALRERIGLMPIDDEDVLHGFSSVRPRRCDRFRGCPANLVVRYRRSTSILFVTF